MRQTRKRRSDRKQLCIPIQHCYFGWWSWRWRRGIFALYTMVYRGIDPGWCIPQTILGEGVSPPSFKPYFVTQSRYEADNTSVNMFMDFLGYGRSKCPLFSPFFNFSDTFPSFTDWLLGNHVNLFSEEISRGGEGLGVSPSTRKRSEKEADWLFRIPHKRFLTLHSFRPLSTWIEPWMGPRSKLGKAWEW